MMIIRHATCAKASGRFWRMAHDAWLMTQGFLYG